MEIGVWGDSIVYGSCDSEGLGWVGRLRKSLPPEDYFGVYNRGVCGDSSADVLKRFSVEATSIEPNNVILAVGINDTKYEKNSSSNKIPVEEFHFNMKSLIREAKVFTNDIYVVGMTKVAEGADRPSGTRFINSEIQRYNSVLERISKEENVRFVAVFDTLDPAVDLFDGLHPNAQGYEKLFTEIASRIKL